MYGKAPQNAKPVSPRIRSLGDSFIRCLKFFLIEGKTKGRKIKKAISHLQNASDTGGTKPDAPLAIARLLVIKIG